MTVLRSDFPPSFRWGAATSSYQIEGAAALDGRTPSIWDTFSHTAGKTKNGDTGDIACDHYHRYLEDVGLMQELGLNAYRFSVSWSRVLPEGRGRVNPAGLDFYARLVDACLERGIEPFLTLYHWDLPQTLEDRGGWGNRDTAHAFAEYAGLLSQHLGDRVQHWMTHNEPWCTAFLGHQTGMFAPGKRDEKLALQVTHHLLLSHGLAIPALRAHSQGAKVGAALNLWTVHAASDAPEDLAAANRYDGFANRWYLDPLYGRGYPADMLEWYGDKAPEVQPGDLETIATETDFLGINYYIRMVMEHDPDDAHLNASPIHPAGEYTAMNWEVYPDGLRECLERVGSQYPVKGIYITENGACYDDTVQNGAIHDHARTAYLQSHLKASLEALRNGAPFQGYFAWSLLDNFEWAEGYGRRFGLTHVDFATQERTLKNSAHWYSSFLKA